MIETVVALYVAVAVLSAVVAYFAMAPDYEGTLPFFRWLDAAVVGALWPYLLPRLLLEFVCMYFVEK